MNKTSRIDSLQQEMLAIELDGVKFTIINDSDFSLSLALKHKVKNKKIINIKEAAKFDFSSSDMIIVHQLNWSRQDTLLIYERLCGYEDKLIIRISDQIYSASSEDILRPIVKSTFYVANMESPNNYISEFTNKVIESLDCAGLGGLDYSDIRKVFDKGRVCEIFQSSVMGGSNKAKRAIAAIFPLAKDITSCLVIISHSVHLSMTEYEKVLNHVQKRIPKNCKYKVCHRFSEVDPFSEVMVITIIVCIGGSEL